MTAFPHPVPARARRLDARRRRLLVGSALSAVIWAAQAAPAGAQAFNGGFVPTDPTHATRSFTPDDPNETITINNETAIIDWGAISDDFLPEGHVATFQNGAGIGDFAVLNRIFSSEGGPIQFNGTVLSRVDGAVGGTVLFQSSTGIIVGANATFDVGNLVLTTLNVGVAEDGYGNPTGFTPGDYSFSGSGGEIEILPDATPGTPQIGASRAGSYVLMVAPRIVQGGTVQVNGSVAYVGATAATLRVNEGLFDIEITGVSGQQTPVEHSGSTTWTPGATASDPRRIYIAAQGGSFSTTQLLLSGTLGFEEASAARVENGEIVLSGGFDIEGGVVSEEANVTNPFANIEITGGTFNADVFGRTTGRAEAVSADGLLSFAGDLQLEGKYASLGANSGDVTVAGDVLLRAAEFESGSPPIDVDLSYDRATIFANEGGSVRISGNATLDASATGGYGEDGVYFVGNGRAGQVGISGYGGTVVIDGAATLRAAGAGGVAPGTPESGGNGQGGDAYLSTSNGSIEIGGGLNVDVSGTGSDGNYSGGFGGGGTFDVYAGGYGGTGSITITGASQINAAGTGGNAVEVDNGVEAGGGGGEGGEVRIGAFDGGTLDLGATTNVDVSGTGGFGPSGGYGNGGNVTVSASDDGAVRLGGALDIDADGTGGEGTGFDGGFGGGGSVDLNYVSEESSGLPGYVGGSTNITISANGTGGNGARSGGNGDGGLVNLVARPDGGEIEFGDVSASVVGTGGDGGTGAGGTGYGGEILAGTDFAFEGGYGGFAPDGAQDLAPPGGFHPAALGDPAAATFGNLSFDASGAGGSSAQADAGSGFGGSAVVQTPTGSVTIGGDSSLIARGTGGDSATGSGGFGRGGAARITASGASLLTGGGGTTEIDVSGFGGDGPNGGTGSGGYAQVSVNGSEMDLDGDIRLLANGTGGNGLSGDGGLGDAGSTEIRSSNDGVLSAGGAFLSSEGRGGNGAGAGSGGQGYGGSAYVQVDSGTGSLTLGDVIARTSGFGGNGGALGAGGDGFGGYATIGIFELGYGILPPSTAVLEMTGLDIAADGIGGDGGAGDGFQNLPPGGLGDGGTIFVDAINGTVRFTGAAPGIALSVDGIGGDAPGGVAGDGQGGYAYVRARTSGTLSTSGGTLSVTSFGRGGDGLRGGNGTGGTLFAGADEGVMTLGGNIELDVTGFGGDGTGLTGGSNGTGGLARLVAIDGGAVSFVRADVISDGRGGSGAPGGTGQAGNSTDPVNEIVSGAFIVAQNGTITGQSGNVSAQGFGGDGDLSDGGDGFGGTAQIVALNSPGGPSSIDLGAGSVNVSARGGTGATSYSGGDAFGGITGVALAETLGNSLTIDNLILAANATGGDAGDAVDSLIGNGGNAYGGFIQVGTSSGNGTGTTGGTATFVTIQGTANATGGNGVAAGSNGGAGEGGALSLLARGGTVTATGSVIFETNGTGGAGGAGGTGGDGTGGLAQALITPRFGTADGADVTVGALSLTSIGTGGAGATEGGSNHGAAFVDVQGSVARVGSIAIEVAGTGAPTDPQLAVPTSISATDSDLTVGGDVTVVSTQDIEVTLANGTLDFGGATSLTSEQRILINATGGTPNFGDLSLDAGTAISADPLTADGDVTFTTDTFAQFVNVTAGGTFSGTAPQVVVDNAQATTIDLTATDSSIISSGTLDAGTTRLTAAGDVIYTELTGGDATVTSTGGSIFGSPADLASLTLNASGDIVIGATNVAQDLSFAAGGGAFFTDPITAGGTFSGTAASLFVGNATAGSVDFNVSGNATLGTIAANDIAVASRDLDIEEGGQIGTATTTRVALTALAQPFQVVIGGTEGEGQGYTLSAEEAGRIRTESLEITAQAAPNPAGAPNLLVRDLTLSAPSGQTGPGVNNLAITLAAGEGVTGVMQVEGALRLENAGANSGIALNAPGGRVQIINPLGSVRVLDANGLPGGSLEIDAANIWSANQEIIDQLAADPNFEGRDEALLNNDGEVEERGYIEGGEILLRVGSTLFVQNSGTADQFAGITVVQNTLTIEPTNQATGQPIQVYAFGRRINADGTFLTNSDYFREVEFGYGSVYTDTSEFNQCVIATGRCPGDLEPAPIDIPDGSEIIEGPVDEAEEGVPPPNPDRQQFVDVSFASESLLEEPVTSGGDSGVWDGEDDDCTDNEPCRPAGSGGQ